MITGRCSCNKVSYVYQGTPLFQVICCCEDCQRASGSSHVPVMGAKKSEFIVVSGTTKTHLSTGGSGKQSIRHFCPDCGSLLFGTPEVANAMVTIYAGSLDDKSIFNPTAVIFGRSKVHWEVFDHTLAVFESCQTFEKCGANQ